MNRRVIGLVTAIVLAAVAAAAIFQYVRTADQRAAEQFEFVSVFVANGQIAAGTAASEAISQGLIERTEIVSEAVVPGAIGSLDQIQGQVAVATIYDGEQIITAKFGEVVESRADRIEVPEGLEAVSFQLNVLPGVAGYVEPGDYISVVALIAGQGDADAPEPEPSFDAEGNLIEAPPALADASFRAQYLVQSMLVLQVGQRVINTDEEGRQTCCGVSRNNESYIFTVALDPVSIEKLIFANTQGSLWATLLPEGGKEPVDTPGANGENLFQ